MSTYTGAALGDAALARELYLWDRERSVAPLSGQRRRRTAAEARADCLRLAAMLDRDLHALLIATSRVDEILARRPEM